MMNFPLVYFVLAAILCCLQQTFGFFEDFSDRMTDHVWDQNLLDRGVSIFSHGLFQSSKEFVAALTVGLPDLLPDNWDYWSSAHYFQIKSSPLPQPGIRVQLFADRNLGNRGPLIRPDVYVDLHFGCEGFQFDPNAITGSVPLTVSDEALILFETGQSHCIPVVHIEHVAIEYKKFRSKGFTSSLLFNIAQMLSKIRETNDGPPSKMFTLAKTRSIDFYTGAAYWANHGFCWSSVSEREKILGQFQWWLETEFPSMRHAEIDRVRELMDNTVTRPKDLLELDLSDILGEKGKYLGRQFLMGQRATAQEANTRNHGSVFDQANNVVEWKGEMPIDDNDETFCSLMERLKEKCGRSAGQRRSRIRPQPRQIINASIRPQPRQIVNAPIRPANYYKARSIMNTRPKMMM